MDNFKQNVKGNGNVTVINNGMQPEEAFEIARQLFRENFPLLQKEAEEVVNKRIDNFLKELSNKFAQGDEGKFESFRDPGMQYALYEAMKSYAKYGTNDLLQVLTDLIKKRTIYDNDFKLKIAIDEAIQLAPKLSKSSLNYLTMLFVCKQVKFNDIKNEFDLIKLINELYEDFPFESSDFSYLNSMGCFLIDLDSPFDRLANTYQIDRELFEKKIPASIDKLPHDYSLAYHAVVLAILNAKLNEKYSNFFELKTWIR